MKKMFNETNVTIMEGILGGMIVIIEIVYQVVRFITYRKEKRNK